jgi:hypothetical protein
MDGSDMPAALVERKRVLPFDLPKTEVGWMRLVAGIAVIALTLALACLNISGAWIGSNGNLPFTMTIFGAEMLAAVCLVLIISAPTLPRKIVGSIVFAVLVWVCIENGKMSVERSFKDIFVGSAESLDLKAQVAKTAADTLTKDAPADLRALKEEKAKLEIERELMQATDEKGIERAQISLQTMGLYNWRVDGIRGPETNAAMISRGGSIRTRLEELDKMIGADAGSTPAEQKANAAIDLADQADKVRGGAVWMNMLLIGLEGARSFGLWCFVIWSTAARTVAVDPSVFRDLQRDADELARRKANLGEGAEKAIKTKTKKKKIRLAIEDMRAEIVKREEILKAAEAEDAASETAEPETDEAPVEDEQPAEVEAENDDTDKQEKAA